MSWQTMKNIHTKVFKKICTLYTLMFITNVWYNFDLGRIVFRRYKSLDILSVMSSLFYDTNEGLRNTASAPYNPVFSCVITLLTCLSNPHCHSTLLLLSSWGSSSKVFELRFQIVTFRNDFASLRNIVFYIMQGIEGRDQTCLSAYYRFRLK